MVFRLRLPGYVNHPPAPAHQGVSDMPAVAIGVETLGAEDRRALLPGELLECFQTVGKSVGEHVGFVGHPLPQPAKFAPQPEIADAGGLL